MTYNTMAEIIWTKHNSHIQMDGTPIFGDTMVYVLMMDLVSRAAEN